MSNIDENQIRDRLKLLSQAGPSQDATDRAMQKVRATLMTKEHTRESSGLRWIFRNSVTKLAAAAVLLIGLGYLGGRLSAPAPLDAEQLRADIESSLRSSLEQAVIQDLLKEMDGRWESAFAAKSAELKDEFQQQVRRDLMEFAARTLTYANNQTDQRLAEFARLIHAARVKDRQRTAEGLQYLESNIGSGLVTLAARTDELMSQQQN
ncbi:MAG: hypothetical protein ISS70_25110 [Phycisphaerae bacterium]|nr:hypothetical protein [Phycisphaerae bacterium]